MGPQGLGLNPVHLSPQGWRYILDDQNRPIPCEDIAKWGRWYEESTLNGRRWVARNEIGDGDVFGCDDAPDRVLVSTMFTALHDGVPRADAPAPYLFETMAFVRSATSIDGDPLEPCDFRFKYRTWEAAEAGHELILREVWALILWEIRPGSQEQSAEEDLYDKLTELEP